MGAKQLDSSQTYFARGDVLLANETGSYGAIKVLKEIYVDELSDYRYVIQYGRLKDDKFVPDKSYTGHADLALYSGKDVRDSYDWQHVPGMSVTPGDVLVDQDGVIYVVQSDAMVWNTKTGTNASLTYWSDGSSYGLGKKLKQVKTANGGKFSKVLKIS
jgi:hypothetical protein